MRQVFDILKAVPLLLFVLAAYFLATIGGPSALDTTILAGTAPSGAAWSLKIADLLVMVGLLVLFIEMLKSTRSSISTMIDQALSMVLFALFIILFMVSPRAATGTFLLLTVMSFIDVLAGFIITVSASRRDINIDHGL